MCDVNIATGEVTQFEFDILLPGRIPWKLIRSYSSIHPQRSLIGFGWKLNLGTWLRSNGQRYELVVDGMAVATVSLPPNGYRLSDDSSGLTIERHDAELRVTNKGSVTYLFPNAEHLPPLLLASAVRDIHGNTVEYFYDQQARLALLIDAMGRRLSLEYDNLGHLTRIATRKARSQDEFWLLLRYEYDHHGDLVAHRDALGLETRYEYADHLLTRVVDRAQRELYYQYDRQQRCMRTWFTGGVWDRGLQFDPLSRRVLVTDPLGYQTLYTQNERGLIVGEVDALGRVREDVIDHNGRLVFRTRSTVAPPELIRFEDANTVVVARRDGETVFVLDALGRPVAMTDPEGHTSRFAYDEAGHDIRSESPMGAVWTYEYNGLGDLVRAVDPMGYVRIRERSNHRLLMRDEIGVVEDARFDELGRIIAYCDAVGAMVETDYDACGRPVVTRYPDNTSTHISFDGEGHPATVTDELGRVTTLMIDRAGTRLDVVRPDGFSQSFRFGLREELVHIVNAKGESAFLEYDAEGRCHRIRYFDGRVEEFKFDDNNKPIALVDNSTGAPLAWAEYDGECLVRESFPDGRQVRVIYGPRGEIRSLENDDVTLLFEWDAERRIVRQESNDFAVDYTFDLRGDCTSALTNTGRRIDYEWDGRRRLTKVVDRERFAYELRYDIRDLVSELQMPNGLVQRFEYDELHRMVRRRVIRPDGRDVCARRFTYDAAGRLSGFEDSIRGRREFDYDSVDNLRSVTDEGRLTEQYQYDPNGNLVVTRDGEAITYARGDRAIRAGREEYLYDERGNLVGIRGVAGETRLAYTGEGWLRVAELATGTIVEFQYDALARRVAKIVDGRRTSYDWNGLTLLGERTDGNAIDYLFLPGSFFVVGMTHGDRHFSFVLDQLGTPTEVLDEAGEIVWSGDYSAFGEVIRRRVDEVPQPFRFLGQYNDAELGWYYTRYRYYAPLLGRFTCSDPLGFNSGLNFYAFGANPINWVDPVGLVHVSVNTATNTATCEVLSKCTWGTKTTDEARKKVSTFNTAKCTVDMSKPCDERESGYKEKYIANNASTDAEKDALRDKLADQGDPCKSIQVDHIKDVQCGGKNNPQNLQELNQSVNASFGSQIRTCLSRLPGNFVGTVALKLVDRNDMTTNDEKNHKKKPCDDSDKKCP